MGAISAGVTDQAARRRRVPDRGRSAAALGTVLLATVLGAVPFASPASAATLVAKWRMEDSTHTMRDSSGDGRHGTATSSVLLRQPGASGYGYRFASAPSYVTVPSAWGFNPGTAGFSVTARVKFTSLPAGGDVNTYDIIRKGLSTTSGGDWKLEIMQSGAAHCLFRGSSGQGEVYGSRNLADGRWHTLTCSRTSSSVRLTVDGVSTTSAKRTGTISNSSPVILGVKNTDGHDQYQGYMDEVSVSRG